MCADRLVWGWAHVGTGAFARPAERSKAHSSHCRKLRILL